MKIYLDMNVYYRIFDDQTQSRIRVETRAIELIFKLIERWQYKLCWSYVLESENNANSAQDMKEDVKTIAELICTEYIKWNEQIDNIAYITMKNSAAKNYDALHLACAIYNKCDYFITCDDKFVKTINTN